MFGKGQLNLFGKHAEKMSMHHCMAKRLELPICLSLDPHSLDVCTCHTKTMMEDKGYGNKL